LQCQLPHKAHYITTNSRPGRVKVFTHLLTVFCCALQELLLKHVTLNVCDACRRAVLWLAMHVQQNPALYLDEDGDAEDDWEDEVPPPEQFAL